MFCFFFKVEPLSLSRVPKVFSADSPPLRPQDLAGPLPLLSSECRPPPGRECGKSCPVRWAQELAGISVQPRAPQPVREGLNELGFGPGKERGITNAWCLLRAQRGDYGPVGEWGRGG